MVVCLEVSLDSAEYTTYRESNDDGSANRAALYLPSLEPIPYYSTRLCTLVFLSISPPSDGGCELVFQGSRAREAQKDSFFSTTYVTPTIGDGVVDGSLRS